MAKTLRLALIGIAAIGYSLVFGEMFLRAFKPEPLVPRYVTGSGDGVRANIPDVAFRQWTPEVDVTVRYNDRGMRDDRPAPPMAKQVGECRVALVGDSYFVGFESDYPHSFAYQLESQLAKSGISVRVLDFAVSGFGTAEDLIVLQKRVAPWRPDVVIMSWHASDPDDNVRSGLFRLDNGALVPTGRNFLPGVAVSDKLMGYRAYRWLIENSHIYSAVRERAGRFTKSLLVSIRGYGRAAAQVPMDAGPDPVAFDLPERDPPVGNAALDLALLQASRAASAAMGAQFLLFDVPIYSSRARFVSPQMMYLGDLPGFATVSALPAFEAVASPDVKLYLEQGQLHWTAQGNALAAGVAATDIMRRGWLQGCARNAAAAKGVEKIPFAP